MNDLIAALKAKYAKPEDAVRALGLNPDLAKMSVGQASSGSDVVVADHNPFKETAMKMTKLGRALFAALSAASPTLAADSALPAMVGTANRKTFKKAEVKAKLLALDAELDPEQLDSVIDALLDVEQEPKPVETPAAAADESPADKIKALLAGKVDDSVIDEICGYMSAPVADAEPDQKMIESGEKPVDVKAAMDSLRKEFREAADAARDVRATVGEVAMDSAAEIYGFALDHLKVEREGVEGVPALRALFKVAASKSAAPTLRVAQDSAATIKQFPGLDRFGHA